MTDLRHRLDHLVSSIRHFQSACLIGAPSMRVPPVIDDPSGMPSMATGNTDPEPDAPGHF